MRLYCANELQTVVAAPIVQINVSHSLMAGTVRGLHFQQEPASETKLVRCTRGRIWDVAVDLRRSSPTFLRWHAEELSDQNDTTMIIPKGFAHGFQTLANDCDVLYFHTESHIPEAERGFRHDDSTLAIPWPTLVTQISERDRGLPPIPVSFLGIDA
jgi:dTDP-4-dehydrorhamnose 3,5-epimerase